MQQVNYEKWAEKIGNFIELYMAIIYDQQQEYEENGMSKDYLKLKRICEEYKTKILNCINNIHNTNLLTYK